MEFHKEVFSILKENATEIQWYMFETRIRQIVTDLIDPFSKHQQDNFQRFIGQANDYEIIKRRVEELEFTFQKVQRQSNQFEELRNNQERFSRDLSNRIQLIRSEMGVHIDRINKMDEKVNQSKKDVDANHLRLESLSDHLEEQVKL